MKTNVLSKLALGIGIVTLLAACDEDYAYYRSDGKANRYSTVHRYETERGGVSEARHDVRRHLSNRRAEVREVRRDIRGDARPVGWRDSRYDPRYDRRYDNRYDSRYNRRVVTKTYY